MKKFISTALLLVFIPCSILAKNVNDTLTVVKITTKIITKSGKPFEGKRFINFHLNDGRVVVLEDKEKAMIPLMKLCPIKAEFIKTELKKAFLGRPYLLGKMSIADRK